MRLHETPIQDPNLGVQEIHTQLKNLCLEMQSMKQDRTAQQKCAKSYGVLNIRARVMTRTTAQYS